MNKRLRFTLIVSIAILAVAGGIAVRQLVHDDREQGLNELQHLALPDLNGQALSFSQWHGKIIVVNFWATWCDPCREEVPALVRIQQQRSAQGVQIVGVGIDSADKMRQFAATYRVNYPLVVAGLDAIEVSRKLGNRAGGLPFTVVLDRKGRFVASHLGGLTEQALNEILRPLLAS